MAALAPAMLLASLGSSVATVALPSLASAFGASVAEVRWVVLAYLLLVTVTIVTAGRLGDRLGQRRMLIAGLALFAAASAASAAAPGLGALIATRAAQGVGGAILMALPVAIVRDVVARERTGRAMGLLGTMSAVGTALGPSLGGLMIAGFGWRAAFASLAAFTVLVLLLAVRTIPATPVPSERRVSGLDLPGAGLLAITLTAYALLAAGVELVPGTGHALLATIALAGLALLALIETRAAAPLVPVALLRHRIIGPSLVMSLIVATVMMSTLVVGPFLLSFALGLNEAATGLVMAVGPVTSALAGIPAGRLTDRLGVVRVQVVGLAQIILGLLGLALLPRTIGVTGYVLALVVMTPGFQLFLAATNTAVMLAARADRRGVLAGLLGLARNLGFMTGASAMASLFAATLGPVAVTAAPAQHIQDAFTTTFLVAAGLTATALVLALAVAGRGLDRSASAR